MRGKLFIFTVLAAMAVMVLAVSASAGNGSSTPPGWDPCGHGATNKPCRPDPQPDNGKDCEHHGNHGGVNEDHCKGENPPPPECKYDKCHPQPPPVTPPVTPPPTAQPCPYPLSGKDGQPGNNDCIPPVPASPTTPVTPLQKQCPAGYTQDAGSASDMLLCTRTVTVEKVVERFVTKTVFGKPKCPKGTKLMKRGPGSVTCLRTKIENKVKYVTRVRVVQKPKPAYTK